MRDLKMTHAARKRGNDIHARWSAAAGEKTAAHTCVQSLKRGVLMVGVGSSALLQDLSMFRVKELLDLLNKENAQPAITNLRFVISAIKDKK